MLEIKSVNTSPHEYEYAISTAGNKFTDDRKFPTLPTVLDIEMIDVRSTNHQKKLSL
jgi:hypothetical protein